jgi:micrococcal nuclease
MYEYNAIITDVYDGDTFTFLVDLGFSITVKEKLRLYGINTPEVRGSEKIFGKEVRDYVENLILGEKVRLEVFKKGKFGRYVGKVWFNYNGIETDLTELLLSQEKGVEFMKDQE